MNYHRSSLLIYILLLSWITHSYAGTSTVALSGTASNFGPSATLSTWLASNSYTSFGWVNGNLVATQSMPATEHVYIFFDSMGNQLGASRLVGYFDKITDRPHPSDAGNTSFTSLQYWNGTAWASKSWANSFCLSGDGSNGATSTLWISCPGTYNPETTNWSVLYAGSANWGGWRFAFLNTSGVMTYLISANATGSDVQALVYVK